MQMFPENACRVVNGHLITGEGHHFAAEFAMQLVERCSLQCLVGLFSHGGPAEGLKRRARRTGTRAPLSSDLRDFAV
jgi:hypothetical protein